MRAGDDEPHGDVEVDLQRNLLAQKVVDARKDQSADDDHAEVAATA
ncbi:hypothetical protein [Mycobacterium sp. 852002-51057_SCH5723018]|nr:hypothetical protein [Mycobacterium sp. 852002-51057_SCH5723018]